MNRVVSENLREARATLDQLAGLESKMIAASDAIAGALLSGEPVLGARVPTQPNGLAFADQNTFQATLDERTCGYGVRVRSIQYIRTAPPP